MSVKTEDSALEAAIPLAEQMKVYIVDVSYSKNEDGDYSLCYYIDKDGGVGIDDCEAFSRAVEEILDRDNVISDKYVLEVSSPGVDRVLKKEREFNYYKGREVDVKLYAPLDGVKEFTGVLGDYLDGKITVVYGDKEMNIPLKQAVYIKLSFKF